MSFLSLGHSPSLYFISTSPLPRSNPEKPLAINAIGFMGVVGDVVWKSFTKGAKAAGKVFEVEPAEAVDVISKN